MLSCWTKAVIVFWSLKPFLRFSRAGRLLQWLSGKEPFCNTGERETWVWSLGWEDPLEEGMAIHSSIVASRILKDEGTWGAMDHRVAKSRTRLSTHACKQSPPFPPLLWQLCSTQVFMKIRTRNSTSKVSYYRVWWLSQLIFPFLNKK